MKKLKEKRLQQRAHLLLEKLTSREVAGEVFDAIKTNNSFNKYRNHQCWVNRKIGQSSSSPSTLCYGCLKKAFLIKNITRTLQVAMASLNGKSTEDSSSNEDSADKSDEADIQELAEDEIQESVEDAQETVKGGVQEATKEALADEAVTLI